MLAGLLDVPMDQVPAREVRQAGEDVVRHRELSRQRQEAHRVPQLRVPRVVDQVMERASRDELRGEVQRLRVGIHDHADEGQDVAVVQAAQRLALAAEQRELVVALRGRERSAPLRLRRVVRPQHVERLERDGVAVVLADSNLAKRAAPNALAHSDVIEPDVVRRRSLPRAARAPHRHRGPSDSPNAPLARSTAAVLVLSSKTFRACRRDRVVGVYLPVHSFSIVVCIVLEEGGSVLAPRRPSVRADPQGTQPD